MRSPGTAESMQSLWQAFEKHRQSPRRRQLASRARRRVQGAGTPPHADLNRQQRVVDAFLAALREGDFEGLMAVLDPEVVVRIDESAARPCGPSGVRSAGQILAANAGRVMWRSRTPGTDDQSRRPSSFRALPFLFIVSPFPLNRC
jgi:hypothetical protein